jgi:hypothetical protein
MPPAVGQFSHDSGGRSFVKSPFGFVHNGGGGRRDACDVLQSEPPRTAIVGNVEDVEEQAAALSVQPSPAPGDRHVLAGESGNDEIHLAAKASCAEASKIAAPHRRWLQRSCFHERNKLAGCRGFPFSIGHCSQGNAEMAERKSDSFVKHPDSGAKADRSEGGISHIHFTRLSHLMQAGSKAVQ